MPRTAATVLLLAFLAPPWWLAGVRASELNERVVKVPVKVEDTHRNTVARASPRAAYLAAARPRARHQPGPSPALRPGAFYGGVEVSRFARLFGLGPDADRL